MTNQSKTSVSKRAEKSDTAFFVSDEEGLENAMSNVLSRFGEEEKSILLDRIVEEKTWEDIAKKHNMSVGWAWYVFVTSARKFYSSKNIKELSAYLSGYTIKNAMQKRHGLGQY